MRNRDMNYEKSAENVKRIFGDNPEKVRLYTVNESVARSGMSAVIRVYAVEYNIYSNCHEPICVAYGRVYGCGLDRGFEAAYNLFAYAYPKLRYQDFLYHRWM